VNTWSRTRTAMLGLLVVLVTTVAVTTVAITPAQARPVLGVTYLFNDADFTNAPYEALTLTCPAGQVAIGGTYRLNGPPGKLVLDDLIPSGGRTLRLAAGRIVGPGENDTEFNWFISGVVICVNESQAVQVVPATSDTGPGTGRWATATCPSGKRVIGSGTSVQQGFGQVSVTNLWVSDTTVTAIANTDEDGFSGSWSVSAYAVCANPPRGLRVESDDTTRHQASGFTAQESVSVCGDPNASVAIGYGWQQTGGGEVSISSSFIQSAPVPEARVTGTPDDTGTAFTWLLGAMTICADNDV
jgi:hypothetical protein